MDYKKYAKWLFGKHQSIAIVKDFFGFDVGKQNGFISLTWDLPAEVGNILQGPDFIKKKYWEKYDQIAKLN